MVAHQGLGLSDCCDFFPEMIASGERVKKKYPALTVSGASEYYHPLVD